MFSQKTGFAALFNTAGTPDRYEYTGTERKCTSTFSGLLYSFTLQVSAASIQNMLEKCSTCSS